MLIYFSKKPGKDFEFLWILRAACSKGNIPKNCKEICGIDKEVAEDLFNKMKNCNYGVIFLEWV